MEKCMKKIRIAILGCGTIGDVHARAIAELPELCTLAAICDVSPERAEAYAKKYNTKGYSDYAEMLADPDIDAVSICTPSGMHADQAIMAMEAGKHVLCEKPMALTTRDAERICECEARTKKTLSVIFQMRFIEDMQYLKRVIADGMLGTLVFCDLYMKYWRDEAYFKVSPWRGTFAMDGGGALMNQGIHGVDIMHFLCGAPRLLTAKVKTLVHNIETEDTAVAAVEYPSGALGVIQASTSANPGFDRRIEIHGSRGYAVVIDAHIEKLFVDGKFLIDKKIETGAGTKSDPTKMSHDKHTLQMKNFVRALRGEEELLSTSLDGLKAVSFIEKVYEASKNS
jgi:predicted dehydrogenase